MGLVVTQSREQRAQLIGILGGLSILLSLFLVKEHYETDTSFCDNLAGGMFSCSSVNRSEYSEFIGVPVAVFGAIWGIVLAFGAWKVFYSSSFVPLLLSSLFIYSSTLFHIYSFFLFLRVKSVWCNMGHCRKVYFYSSYFVPLHQFLFLYLFHSFRIHRVCSTFRIYFVRILLFLSRFSGIFSLLQLSSTLFISHE